MSAPSQLVAVLGGGVLDDPARPVLAADDVGLTRGDGCFDATRIVVRPGLPTHVDHLDAHLARFARSAAALQLPYDEAAWRGLIDVGLAAWSEPGEAILRVMLTRGRESALGGACTGVLTIAAIDDPTVTARRGISVVTLGRGHAADAFADCPWLLGGVKTLSYALNLAVGREARRRGADDALFVSTDGFALEAPRSALVWRIGDALTTTRLGGTGILASVTQSAAFDRAEADGVPVGAGLIAADRLRDADGAWLLSAGRLVAPILRLDGLAMCHDTGWTERLRRWADPLTR